MSLQTRYRPWLLQAGPSDHIAPVHRRWIGVFPWRRPLKLGSIVRTSGSAKYTFGAALGPKSRGGVVTVVKGAAGPIGGACARAVPAATSTAPAPMPIAVINARRDIRPSSCRSSPSRAIERTSSKLAQHQCCPSRVATVSTTGEEGNGDKVL